VTRLTIRPAVMLGGAAVIVLLPLAAAATGLAFVIAAIAATCALIIAATIAPRRSRSNSAILAVDPVTRLRTTTAIQAARTTRPPSA
jgi:hypothetical protein